MSAGRALRTPEDGSPVGRALLAPGSASSTDGRSLLTSKAAGRICAVEDYVCSPTEEMNEDSYRVRNLRPDCVGHNHSIMGSVWGIYGAGKAQEAALSVLRAARGDLFFWGYTLDREDIIDGLIEAHEQNNVVVKVTLDKKMTFSGNTRNMFEQVARLCSNSCLVRVAKGGALDKVYYAAGRRVKSGFEGVCHAKAILTGTWFLPGSTNLTTSSRGNVERSSLLEMTDHAARMQYQAAQADWDAAEEFTEDLRRNEEHRRSGSVEPTRSRSEPAPRTGFGDFH
jgi:hypothetical protein